jgi:hypothetical protein
MGALTIWWSRGFGLTARPVVSFLCLVLMVCRPAAAVIFEVTTSSDTVVVDGVVSLREAMTAAVTNAPSGDAAAGAPGYDLIRFNSSFTVFPSGPLPTITEELEILGVSPYGSYIDANYGFRPFVISAGTSVTLDRLVILHGVAPANADGGAILNAGVLTVKNGNFLDCVAPARGGAIYTGNGSRLEVWRTNFGGCFATTGGAVMVRRASSASLSECSVFGGFAAADGGAVCLDNCDATTISQSNLYTCLAGGLGGAIMANCQLWVGRCAIFENDADYGGGLYKSGVDPLEIENSTFSRNEANHSGGGLLADAGRCSLNHVTMAENNAKNLAPEGGSGGGIHRTGRASVTISNCLVANNINDNFGTKPDIAGTILSGGYNLIGNLGSQTFPANTVGDRYGDPGDLTPPNAGAIAYLYVLDPLIGSLGVNPGAQTVTHCLLSGSVALNTANPASTATEDQRDYARPQESRCDRGAFESLARQQWNEDTFDAGLVQPPGSTNGWGAFGSNTPGFAWPDYSVAAGAYRLRLAADATRYRVTGVISNLDEWLPYFAVNYDRVVRARFYIYAAGQSNPSDLNQIPNLRMRLCNRFAVNSMLEVFHQNPGDPANAALASELRPSSVPASPSLYRVDFDPVDVPYLGSNQFDEGVARAVEAYALFPQENGHLGLTESAIGTYAETLISKSGPTSKVYAPDSEGPGDLELFNPTELALLKLIPGAVEGGFAMADPVPPFPTHTTSTLGITLDSSPVPSSRIGVAAREFNPDRNTSDHANRVRVQPARQYTVRWFLTSTRNTNQQAQIRLRARSIKFAWSQKMEIGGAWATDGAKTYPLNANNAIAQQALPGVGTENPDNDGFAARGWFSLIMHTPISVDIRGDFAPGTPMEVRMPGITAQPGPGVASPSRRDIFLGMDLVDSLSGGLGAPLEQGNVTLLRAEIRTFHLVPD